MAPPAALSDGTPPCQTLYVSNMVTKPSNSTTKKALFAMFSQFGVVVDVVASKSWRLRGQAWVVFEKAEAAEKAKARMAGFPFFDREIRIEFAKTKSDAVRKMEGTYVARTPEAKREHREAEKARVAKMQAERAAQKAAQKEEAARQSAEKAEEERIAAAMAEEAPPHNILFVQNLPAATNDMMLRMLFQQFAGFQEVRMVEARPGIAFVEFDNERQAGAAMGSLQGFKVTPENAMKIAYAKK